MINIEAVDYNWLYMSDSDAPKLSGLNWGAPNIPRAPITVFGRQVDKFMVGKYGQLKFLTYPDGRVKYSDVDSELPETINHLSEGYQVIGFGEPLKVKGCGVTVKHGIGDSNYIIEFNAIHKYTHLRQRFQYVFPLKEHNKIIVNYRSVTTGANTIIGAVANPGTGDQWEPLAYHAYHNTAVMIDTAVDIETTPTIDPPVVPTPEEDEWRTVYDGAGYRVQEIM